VLTKQATLDLLVMRLLLCVCCAADSAEGFPKGAGASYDAGLSVGKGKVRQCEQKSGCATSYSYLASNAQLIYRASTRCGSCHSSCLRH
jgi:hypothetical protein